MQPMATIRNWHIDQMKKTINTLKFMLQSISDADAKTIRDGGDGWTVLEIMSHLRDFEAVFIERVQLTLTQDNPDLPFPDPEGLVTEHKYNEGNLQHAFETWQHLRSEFVKVLEGVAEEQWERPAKHPTRGNFTLTDQLLLTVWHDMNHIEQIAHIMLGKA